MTECMGILLRGILALAVVILPFQAGANMVFGMGGLMSEAAQIHSQEISDTEVSDTDCDTCCVGSECAVTHCVVAHCSVTAVAIVAQSHDFSFASARLLSLVANVLIFSSHPVSIFRPPRS